MSGYRIGQEIKGMRRGVVVYKRKHGQTTIYTVDWDELGRQEHSVQELRQLVHGGEIVTRVRP